MPTTYSNFENRNLSKCLSENYEVTWNGDEYTISIDYDNQDDIISFLDYFYNNVNKGGKNLVDSNDLKLFLESFMYYLFSENDNLDLDLDEFVPMTEEALKMESDISNYIQQKNNELGIPQLYS